MGWALTVTGISALNEIFADALEWAEKQGDTWWVGTIVHYAFFLEFGTSRMTAKRFFRMAIRRVARKQAKLKIDQALAKSEGLPVPADPGVAEVVAFELEREVKKVIRQMGLIDTSNLRGSFQAAPSLTEEMRKSERATLPSYRGP